MKKTLLIIVSAVMFLGFANVTFVHANASDETIKHLKQLKWKNRVLLVLNPTDRASVELALTSASKEINDRDLVWIVLADEKLSSNIDNVNTIGLRAQLRAKAKDSKNIVLIGKDGGVKYQAPSLDLQQIYKTIDAMPMRKQEIKEKQ